MKGAGKGGKGVPPAKGLGKGMPPPPMGKGGPAKGPPMMPGGALSRPVNREAMGPKLRPLFWASVNQVPPESVWADLVEPAPFDKALLERQFALADSRTPTSLMSRSASDEPRKRVRVFDDRTSQMLAIAFNRLPPPEQVAQMVDSLEDFPDGLTSEAVLALHNAVSEHGEAVEQIRLVATNQETIAQLDVPERFLLRLSSVAFCNVKLACGALIVGSAKELMDLRLSGQKVGVCCQDLRKSKLLQKCISTSLAVGNFLNRGTARSGCRGVVLPEALLKLEELRGGTTADPSGDGGDKEKSGLSVLDFVAQALVNEEGANEDDLRMEAERLLANARAASSVSLEETEASCRKISAEATKVRQAVGEVPTSPGLARMIQRVDSICKEATLANEIARKAKEQLAKTQLWSCCKGVVKSDTWFTSWTQLLELLPRALVRAQQAKAKRLVQEEAEREAERQRLLLERPPLSDVNSMFPPPAAEDPAKKRARDLQATCLSLVHKLSPSKDAIMTPDGSQKQASRTSRANKVARDDEARIDNIDWSKVNQHNAMLQDSSNDPIKRRSASSFNDKENGFSQIL